MASGKTPKNYPTTIKATGKAPATAQSSVSLASGESVSLSAPPAVIQAQAQSALDRGVDIISFDTPNGPRAFNVADLT